MSDPFFQPVSGMALPRYAGIPTFMRLPPVLPGHPRFAELDIGILGLPWDGGTTNRPGARHGPRAIRDASTMVRGFNRATGVKPFEAANCADIGDVAGNPCDQDTTLGVIRTTIRQCLEGGVRPLSVGGDHLCTLPVLRALGESRPVGLVLFDSHTDLYRPYFGGAALTHGNPFARAVTEGLIDPARSIMIGIRGTGYDNADLEVAAEHGIRIVTIEELFDRGIPDVMEEARTIATGPVYVSFDIDFVDPAYAPGTGTPEIGGPTSFQAQQAVRALRGLEIVGADLVEVSPPFDTGGVTAWLGASILFEILCVMAPDTR